MLIPYALKVSNNLGADFEGWTGCLKKAPPGCLRIAALNATLEQADNFSRKMPKVNKYSLVCFEALELLLSDLQNVQKLQVLLT